MVDFALAVAGFAVLSLCTCLWVLMSLVVIDYVRNWMKDNG